MVCCNCAEEKVKWLPSLPPPFLVGLDLDDSVSVLDFPFELSFVFVSSVDFFDPKPKSLEANDCDLAESGVLLVDPDLEEPA